jgi:hypothetical protein
MTTAAQPPVTPACAPASPPTKTAGPFHCPLHPSMLVHTRALQIASRCSRRTAATRRSASITAMAVHKPAETYGKGSAEPQLAEGLNFLAQ